MKLIALDTACAACSAAVWADGTIAASRTAAMKRGHAEALLPMILDVMGASSVAFASLDMVAVTLGPGSFTGLRTGLATAKGIALAHDLPIVGVTSLEAVALAAQSVAPRDVRKLPLTVVLETRRGGVYLQNFAADRTPLDDPCSATLEEAMTKLPKNGAVLAGDAASRIVSAMGLRVKDQKIALMETVTGPDARYVAEIAAGRWVDGGAPVAAGSLAPLYVQAPEAKRPIAGGRLRS
ncbi:MAG: tRNA (adenosine(37)-N6)-threonylcarbamoyltransferase complex dimerization subunit type 1 TsaB [Rhodospirillaceae bacterium]|jgi:tRNA threonylcarbamoyladenosine biosynthesis protein TsaB|nr:tRNA (adenosine(37)-N6)-threonylcarbamoyltransferase complex dimerization subunit type 1 TsaB [Rhodospirillaceae bacterium]MBT5456347.1 tRNA (adenosine(37)-N6)-threonylcarbamoyltransferase complex dimerization subunit type 1 TsaB [Rhodospirillaceae bacterium]